MNRISFSVSIMYLLATPVVYHAYYQWMFINYMPFLILGLLGVDRYFRKKHSGMLVVSVWMMVLTSFYFSIGGMLGLCLYGLYRYLEEQGKIQKPTFGELVQAAVRRAIRLLLGVLLSAVLLILLYLLYTHYKKIAILIIPTIVMLGGFAIVFHANADKMVTPAFLEELMTEEVDTLILNTLENDTEVYRMEQQGNHSENAANINRIHTAKQRITSEYSSCYAPDYMEFRTGKFDVEAHIVII